MSRADTEERLEEVALQLLKRDGVLAGLNLREVADEAGINRGLVYHYYGTRRDLLRSALRKGAQTRLGEVRSGWNLPFASMWRRFLRVMTVESEAVQLMTLLVIDGDDRLRTMPLRRETAEHLRQAVNDGHLAADTDLEATHACLVSLTYGYVCYRAALAREFALDPDDLDERVMTVFDRLLRGLGPLDTRPASSTET